MKVVDRHVALATQKYAMPALADLDLPEPGARVALVAAEVEHLPVQIAPELQVPSQLARRHHALAAVDHQRGEDVVPPQLLRVVRVVVEGDDAHVV